MKIHINKNKELYRINNKILQGLAKRKRGTVHNASKKKHHNT